MGLSQRAHQPVGKEGKEVKEVISSSASSESDLNEEEVRAREWHRPTERPLMRLIGGDPGGGRP